GVDLMQIDGLNSVSVLTLISETGLDASKWKSEKHFTSWLGLAPNNKISGGKILSSNTKKVKSRANNIFRMAAQSLLRSNSYPGGFYRRQRYRLGVEKAIVATARKIAVIYYNMLKYGQWYHDYGCEHYEQQYKEKNIKYLKLNAGELGLELVAKSA
ncbi:MAG: transposase, partial [Spirochaetota bacterium]|nr:transposase [Spirochaetota bacterium]